jgi:hypothetical protein
MSTYPTVALRLCFAHGFCRLRCASFAAAELLCGMMETEYPSRSMMTQHARTDVNRTTPPSEVGAGGGSAT